MKQLEKIYEIFLKYRSVKIDSRKIKKGDIFFAISGNNFNANRFAKESLERGAILAVIDDADFFDKNNERIILVNNSLKTLQNLAKKYRQDLNIPFLGITGSNGKTTTKELLREVLSQKYEVSATEGNLNNHLGVPLTILAIKPEHNFSIIEMGANHLGEITELCEIAQPNFGIITNISRAHIGEFGNFENIKKTKMALYDFLDKNEGKKFEDLKQVKVLNDDLFLTVEIFNKKVETKLVGDYNSKNIGVAVGIGKFFDIEEDKIIEAISNYQPKNNRSQFLQTDKKNNIFLDAYNANPESMSLSLQSFFNKELTDKTLIIGDMKELGKYSEKEHQSILDLILKNIDFLSEVYLIGPEFFAFNDKYNFQFFENKNNFLEFLEKINLNKKNILIKASRSIGLEEIVERKLV